MQHPDEGRLHEYADGALAPAETAALERHLAECEACRAALGQVHALLGESDRLVAKLQLEPPLAPVRRDSLPVARPWWRSRTLALAASALLVVGIGWIALDRDIRRAREAAEVVAAPAPDAAGAATLRAMPDSTPVQAAPAARSMPAPEAPRELANAQPRDEVAKAERAPDEARARAAAPAPAAPTATAREPMAMRADTPPAGAAKRPDGVPLNDLPRWKPQVAAEAPAAGIAAPRFGIEGLQALSHEPLPGGGTRTVYSVDGTRVELDQGPGAAPARRERSAQYEVSWELDGTRLTLRAALAPAQVEALRARVR